MGVLFRRSRDKQEEDKSGLWLFAWPYLCKLHLRLVWRTLTRNPTPKKKSPVL